MDVLAKGIVVVPESTRLGGPSFGATNAASLQHVANRPIICHVIDALSKAGVAEAAVVAPTDSAGEIAACIAAERSAAVVVRLLTRQANGDDSSALAAAADFVGGASCILHRSDGLLGQPLAPLLRSLEHEREDALLLVQAATDEAPTRPRALRLVEADPREAPEQPPGVAGVCLLGPGVLAKVPNPGRAAQLLDFAAITEQLARDGGTTEVQVARKWRHFAGDALDLLDMNRTILDQLEHEAIANPADGNRFEGQVEIHPTARVTSSVIIGPVLIGAHVQIGDSYIGPHTSIAEGVRIEGSELERSIVLADASLLHVGGRLVASVVGRRARIFRDFSMPRALRLQVGDGDEVALC